MKEVREANCKGVALKMARERVRESKRIGINIYTVNSIVEGDSTIVGKDVIGS